MKNTIVAPEKATVERWKRDSTQTVKVYRDPRDLMFNEEDFVPYEQWYRGSRSEPPSRFPTARNSASTMKKTRATERSVVTIE
jgi:hypothetical protein